MISKTRFRFDFLFPWREQSVLCRPQTEVQFVSELHLHLPERSGFSQCACMKLVPSWMLYSPLIFELRDSMIFDSRWQWVEFKQLVGELEIGPVVVIAIFIRCSPSLQVQDRTEKKNHKGIESLLTIFIFLVGVLLNKIAWKVTQ